LEVGKQRLEALSIFLKYDRIRNTFAELREQLCVFDVLKLFKIQKIYQSFGCFILNDNLPEAMVIGVGVCTDLLALISVLVSCKELRVRGTADKRNEFDYFLDD
jgi:hypothetical protein